MGIPGCRDKPEMSSQAEEKRERPEWYRKTIRRFKNYTIEKKKLQVLQTRLTVAYPSQTTKYTQTPVFTVGNHSDQTGNHAMKRTDLTEEITLLEQSIREVEIIFDAFGEMERELIKLRYFDHYTKDWHVAMKLDIPLRTYYRYRDETILTAAEMFVYIRRDQVSFEELGWRY